MSRKAAWYLRGTIAGLSVCVLLLNCSFVCAKAESGGVFSTAAGTRKASGSQQALGIVTKAYKQEAKRQIMDFNAPVPTEMCQTIFAAWKEETFGPYEAELRALGAKDEGWIKWGGRILDAYDYQLDMNNDTVGDMFQNYIARDEIVRYVVEGKGEKVFCDKKGVPLCLIIVPDQKDKKTTDKFEKKVIKGFQDAITWYQKNGDPDICDSLRDNGFIFFFVTVSHPEKAPDAVYLTDRGGIAPNMDYENSKMMKNFRNVFIFDLFVESYGITFFQEMKALGLSNNLGGGYYVNGYNEVVKSLAAMCVATDLTGVDKIGMYAMSGVEFANAAVNFHNSFLERGVDLDQKTINRLLNVLACVVNPIGFDSLYDVDAFNDFIEAR